MKTELELVESKPSSLHLSGDDAALLLAIGRELASTRAWWGDTQPGENRSVIDVKRVNTDTYDVTFREVIGVVQLGEMRIRVGPKIPWEHFAYIACRSERSPRLSTHVATVEPGFEFIDMLCRWFIDSTEALLRTGLRKDYSERTNETEEVRGSLLPLNTAIEVLKGRLVAVCTFDELSFDTSLNRIVRAASERVSRLNQIGEDTRRRARRLVYRMDGVGPLREIDHRRKPDRLSRQYLYPISLARLILEGCGISLSDGNTQGTSFLLRTPEIMEEGLRSIIADALPTMHVTKRRQILGDSGISMNPDIVFGNHLAIADVKYKYFSRDWNRNDLNQIITFATAFNSQRCALFGFVSEGTPHKPEFIQVGRIDATRIAWPVGQDLPPELAAHAMTESIKRWLPGE